MALKKDIHGFTATECLNKETPQIWECRKDIWGQTAADGPPKVIDWTESNEENATIHLDVSDCNVLQFWAHCEWNGVFSDEAVVIGYDTTWTDAGGLYSLRNTMKYPWGHSFLQVPLNAKYFNYRITNYGSSTSNRPIVCLKM